MGLDIEWMRQDVKHLLNTSHPACNAAFSVSSPDGDNLRWQRPLLSPRLDNDPAEPQAEATNEYTELLTPLEKPFSLNGVLKAQEERQPRSELHLRSATR